MKNRLGTIILLVAMAAAAGCGNRADEHGHEEDHHDEHSIESVDLSGEIQRSVGLTSEKVEREKFYSLLEVYGSIAQDTENTVHITSGTSGILHSILAGEGQTVEKGEVVASIEANDGVHEIHSPLHGVVLARYARQGDRIDAVTSLLTIANPDILRASFDVYEKDIGKVAVGQEVAIKSAAYKDRKFPGKVVFVSPRVDETTRTVKIGVDVRNSEDHLLKFGMFVTGLIKEESEAEALVIPAESVQTVHEQTVSFVRTGEDTFEMRSVQKGRETDEQIEILKGLREGEEVVVKGSFILKSEFMKGEMGGHDH